MNWKRIALWTVLADFSALTAYAVWREGLVGIFQLAFASWGTGLLFADLTIALSLIAIWLWNDARARGLSPLPYLVLGALFGSVGPLVYLLRRERAPLPASPNLAVRRATA